MAVSDYARFQHGNVVYPLTSSTVNPLLLDADPSLFYVLEFFTQIIRTHVEPRLMAEVNRSPSVAAITGAVQMALPWDPEPFLTDTQVQFPLLAVYRQKETYRWHVQAYMEDVATWGVQYILPPITAGQADRVMPILRSVGQALLNRIENHIDPTYRSGADVWALANLQQINLTEASYGSWGSTKSNMVFAGWQGTLIVKERDMPLGSLQFQTLAGMDNASDVSETYAPALSDVVDSTNEFAAVDPSTITGIAAMWKADTGAVLAADGYHVAQWTDSVSSITATPPNTQPRILRSTLVDKVGTYHDAIRFDRQLTNCALQATVNAIGTDGGRTFVILARADDLFDRQAIFTQTQSADSGTSTLGLEANTSGGQGGRLGFYASTGTQETQAPIDPYWHVLSMRVVSTAPGATISTNVTTRVDGVVYPSASVSGPTTWQTTFAASTLFQLATSRGATNGSIDIGMVLIFSQALSDADLLKAETACRQYGGL